MFFMLSGALRSAGDARTPMVLGIAMTVLNIVFNVVLIRGLGPIPAYGTAGAAMGTVHRVGDSRRLFAVEAVEGRVGRAVPARARVGPGLDDHQVAVQVRPADGHSGHRDEHRRRVDARVHRIARAERRSAGSVRGVVLAAILVHHVDVGGLMGAASAMAGQNLGAGNPDRAIEAVHVAARIGSPARRSSGSFFLFFPRQLLGDVRDERAGA